MEYEGEYFPSIVTNKLEKEVQVNAMIMSGPKAWKWPECCNKFFIALPKF